jgi:hypothetical protein
VQGLADSKRVLGEQQRIAIGLRARHMIPGQIAVRSRPIFHHDGLAERLLQVVRNLASQCVGRTPGHERDDETDRPIGIGRRTLRLPQGRSGEQGAHDRPLE